MKDWTGNGNSIYKTLGASNHTDKERETDDFYATSPRAIDALLEYADLHLPHKIWEPSCGTGCLSLRLTELGYDVTSTDLIDRGFGTGGVNFFEQRQMPDGCQCIVTNPPYKYATEYVRHSLRLLPDGGWLCLFLKTTFAEGQERHREIFSPTPPHFGIAVRGARALCQERRLRGYAGRRRLSRQLRMVDMAERLPWPHYARLDKPPQAQP